MKRQRALSYYIRGITGIAFAVLILCTLAIADWPPRELWTLFEVVFFIGLGWLCSSRRVYYTETNAVLMGTISQIATIIILPLPLAILAVATAKVINQLVQRARQKRRLVAILLNVSSPTLAVAGAAIVFTILHGTEYLWQADHSFGTALALPALAFAAFVYYALDALIISGAITLSTQETLWSVLVQVSKDTFLPDLSLGVVGVIFAILWHFSPLLSLLMVVPIFLSVRSFAAVARLRDETEKAVKQMAKSVDIRDTGTGVHSQQLERFAERLAKAIGLTPEHVHEIGLAARAHDLGKIEISDSILLKRGPLTPEERLEMQEHPTIGAEMLASYSGFAKSVEFVKHHHERWDGRGYPDGLAGESIPIGARVIAVVDSFDAMTADRPYRKAMSVHEAVSRLKADMGTQFDAKICAAWIQILIDDGTYVPAEKAPHLQLVADTPDAQAEAS